MSASLSSLTKLRGFGLFCKVFMDWEPVKHRSFYARSTSLYHFWEAKGKFCYVRGRDLESIWNPCPENGIPCISLYNNDILLQFITDALGGDGDVWLDF